MTTRAPERQERPRLLAPFEGLRGFAALAVFIYHFHHVAGLDALTALAPGFFGSGWVFVDVFFVLSGWVIAHVYADRLVTGSATLRNFFAARIARLWPLHMTVLVAWFALAPALFGAPGVASYAGCFGQLITLSFTWGLLACAAPVPPAWSISAEMVAYMVFPVLVALGLTRNLRGGVMLLVAGLGGYLAMQAAWGGFHVYDGRAPLRAVAGFSIGAGLWRMERAGFLPSGRLQVVAAAALIVGVASNAPPFALLLVSIFLIATLGDGTGPVARFLSSRPAMTLGRLSFGLYLWHWFAIAGLAALGAAATPIMALVAVLAVLGLAEVSYRLIEMPARERIKSVMGRSGQTVQATPHEG
ncbi:acyltransferase [Maritimibacter sp. UBA3975]|uniref:acyltransferase family protein n=1 Tax=Maritimibacter sp. UBA3975 TaxID=1946833 RepID=UPI000C0AEE43|nr:acyltransferase [Maritimibacter sp. UBA3975]MAM61594.1 hypothetical protein [Maritimibacter sp.]|tara:strand:- start:4153 stop:5226 length:1074 start_codon:yes stop_codon:yes gene_type:complete